MCHGLLLSISFNLGNTVICKVFFPSLHLDIVIIIMSYLIGTAWVSFEDFFVWLEDSLC